MSIELRHATEADVPAVVEMLATHWSQEDWCLGKYRHYYRDYPEGRPLSLIAAENGLPVAHFGLLPIRISGISAGLVLQVLVRDSHRRGPTLVNLVRYSEAEARKRGMGFLCGFGNRRFAKVAGRFLRWNVLGYLSFSDIDAIDLSRYRERFHFEYGDDWYRWKFGRDAPIHSKEFIKDGVSHHQLLKTRGFPDLSARDLGAPAINLWHPERNLTDETEGWIQPFLFVPLAEDLPRSLFDISRWYVEMGDSDTFEPYRPWRTVPTQ